MVEPHVQKCEISRSQNSRPDSSNTYDLYLRARHLQHSSDERDNAAAYEILQSALLLQPNNVHVISAAAEALHHRTSVGWRAFGSHDREAMIDLSHRGLALGAADGTLLGHFGAALFTAREFDEGLMVLERGIEAIRQVFPRL
jgi:hypothetical protein